MTKQEIIDLIARKGENEIDANGNAWFTMPSTEIVYIADDIIARQDERLKEFVEWYKSRLTCIQEHEKELLVDDTKHQYAYLVEYRKGTNSMLDRLLYHIDSDLEKFLEETRK